MIAGKKLLLLLGILGVWMSHIYAQHEETKAPGYEGFLTPVSLDVNIAPAIAYGLEEGLWGPNFRLGLNVERVISRQISVGLSGYGFQSRVRYGFREPFDLEGIAQVSSLSAGLSLRVYTFRGKGNIAPIGPYHKLETLFLHYWVEDLDARYPLVAGPQLGQFNDLAITYTFGTQRILHKNITYNLGIQAGTLVSLFSTSFSNSAEPHDLGAARIIRNLSLTVNMGIGFLL